jgi:hypothetical protein
MVRKCQLFQRESVGPSPIMEASMSAFYQPKEIDLLASVLDRACAEKPVIKEADKEAVAVRILYEAERGERDPDRLLKRALGS